MTGARQQLELRPIATVLERYLAELAGRAGLPRPGILSPETCPWAAHGTAHPDQNIRSGHDDPAPSSRPGV